MLLFSRWVVVLLMALAWTGCSTSRKSVPQPESVPAGEARPSARWPGLEDYTPIARTNTLPYTNAPTLASPQTNPLPTVNVNSNAPAPPHVTVPAVKPHAEILPEWVEMRQWSLNCGLAQLEAGRGGGIPRFALHSPRGDMDFTVKSQTAHWKGMAFLLGFAPQTANGRFYIHRLDVQNNVLPLLRKCDCAVQTDKILVLDPGHGGEPGSRTPGGRAEKELTLDLALRTQALLVGHGWEVYLTRTNDVEVPLTNRVAVAESLHADLFISLHFNSLPNIEQCGIETYCTTPAGMPSNLVRGSEDLLPQVNNANDAENLCWALQLHHELVRATHAVDRGVRRARFLAVLRTQKRPAILIEGGYLSNRKEAGQVTTEAYRQKMAEALARAILKQ